MKLIIIFLLLFISSFFLPAFEDAPGISCAILCATDLLNDSWVAALYYGPFTLSNILMLLLPVLLITWLRRRRVPRFLIIAQAVLLIHTASWLFLTELNTIGIGYYVWLASMLLMLWITTAKKTVEPSVAGDV
jgi:hypothetical protein